MEEISLGITGYSGLMQSKSKSDISDVQKRGFQLLISIGTKERASKFLQGKNSEVWVLIQGVGLIVRVN